MTSRNSDDRQSYSYVRYEKAYRADVIALQKMLWSADPRLNSEYLSWKYEDNPYLTDVHICLAIHDGDAVGMRGAWGSCWTTGDKNTRYIIPCVGDMVIGPAHRGRGVLRGFNEFMSDHLGKEGFPFLLSLSASKPVYFGSLKVGWTPLLEYNELERFPGTFSNRRARKLRNLLLDRAPIVVRRLRDVLRPRGSGKCSVPDIELCNTARVAAMARLADSLRQAETVGPVRDEDFYAWRFRCPLSRYHFLYAGKSPLDGYMVLQHRPMTPHAISIVDWEATSETIFEKLLTAAIEFAGISDLQIWSTSIPSNFVSRLRSNGFVDSKFVERNGYQQSLMIQETDDVESGKRADEFRARLDNGNPVNLRMIISDDY